MAPRILVIYDTGHGQTRKVAMAVARTLELAGAEAEVANAKRRDPRPEDYAAVIVAAPVHAGGYPRPVRRWVRKHAAALGSRPSAFVSVCLAILERSIKAEQEVDRILTRFFQATGWRPAEVKVVAGALPYTRYNWFIRRLMRRIVAKAHGDTDTTRDYEYTDWKDLEAFVRRFAAPVKGLVSAAG